MANVFDPDFDIERDDGEYRWRRAKLGAQAGSERLGLSLFELAPGAATFPLHAHFHNEELLIVLAGRPTLRTLEDTRTLAEGEVVAFPAGRRGAHHLRNDTGEPIRVLIASTMLAPEINEFPDTGEIWVRDYVPGHDPPNGALDVHLQP
jgi:uncharacterized cupin superfamily protein